LVIVGTWNQYFAIFFQIWILYTYMYYIHI
jgi:hypothetical protein